MKAKMMLRPVQALTAMTVLGMVPTLAHANDGAYLGLEGGWNYENNQNLRTNPSAGASARFDNGLAAGVNGGYSYANGLRPELELDWRRNDVRKLQTPIGGVDASGFDAAYTGFGNLWYDLKGQGVFAKLHPYIGGGAGFARLGLRHYDVAGPLLSGYDSVFAWQGGAGLGYDLSRNLSVSLDYRYVQTDRGHYEGSVGRADSRYRASSALFGVRYTFAAPLPPAPVAAPAPTPVAAAAPSPAPVDGDDDGDGVRNSKDKCPGTPKGFKVDADGCIVEQTVVLRAVNFEFNSDALTAPSKDTLDEVAKALVGQPGLNVEIAGHTDDRGAAAYNLKLSQKRAESVRAYLIGKGAPAASLAAKGYGKTKPVADNKTEAGRAENRRVEFVVLNKVANVKVKTEDSTSASKAAAEEKAQPVVKKKAVAKKAAQ